MSSRDPELVPLLIQELERHGKILESGVALEEAVHAVHALKGSAGLAGEPELASSLQRLERRLRAGDALARKDAERLARSASARLRDGKPAVSSTWPRPPNDLPPALVLVTMRAKYMASAHDCLASLDDALGWDDSRRAVEAIYRHVHTLKGAAGAVGDEVMAWFCHGLEERVRRALDSGGELAGVLAEVAEHRPVLAGLLDDPEGTLALLRSRGGDGAPSSASFAPPCSLPLPAPLGLTDEATIRIATASVDAVLDRLAALGTLRDGVDLRAAANARDAGQVRALRAELADALQLIGPPRPWGAPAEALRRIEGVALSLMRMADDLEHRASEGRAADQALRDITSSARRQLLAMRQTPLGELFGRVAAAALAEARRAGKEVQIHQIGADETLDRRLAEKLLEPCLQFARNAIAHGIELREQRRRLGKPEVATLTLSARRSASRLAIDVADDGAGVNVDEVRRRALDSGAVTPSLADAADDDTLLALLFLPGFSTRDHADLLAGRGIGLDIALSAIGRLGGTLRLDNHEGVGFAARIEVPVESGLASLLWIQVDENVHALHAAQVLSVRRPDPGQLDRVPHLASCLELGALRPPRFVLELEGQGGAEAPFFVGVDGVSGPEEGLVRPLTPLAASMGPYVGAIVRGDGSVRLVLDVVALAPRARALGRVLDVWANEAQP